MNKHTPGPWNVNSALGTHYAVIGAEPVLLTITTHAGVGAYICDLVGDADTLENARLIAAAPELLAALQLAETALAIAGSYVNRDQTRIIKAHEAIRAAIAKATA